MNDPMRRLDRAFSEAPSELSYAVERAFERGEKAMKQRQNLMTVLSVAVGVAVLFAAIGLAGSQLSKTVPDNVTTAVTKPLVSQEVIYYATGTGNYYHTDQNCSGMEGALPMTADAILALGKEACPVCCGDAVKLCWATEQGAYYHHDRECSGMQGAVFCTVAHARVRGQKPCPLCLATE